MEVLPVPDFPDWFWQHLDRLRARRIELCVTPEEEARRARARRIMRLGWAEDVARRREYCRLTNPKGLETYAPSWPHWADHLSDAAIRKMARQEARKKERGQLSFDLDD